MFGRSLQYLRTCRFGHFQYFSVYGGLALVKNVHHGHNRQLTMKLFQ